MTEDSGTNHRHSNSSPAIHLAGDEIHVWSASLAQPTDLAASFSSVLSLDEKARAERFYFERDRIHFVLGRGLLRKILGGYLGMEPAWIEFSYGPYGKPALKTGDSNHTLQFNLAHSKGLALLAFCWNRPLGIDLEHVRPMASEDDFAAQVFSASESALIASLTGEQKRQAFFKIWTCKEAFFKASGDGLTKPIDQAEIALDAGEAARLVSIAGDPQQASGWRLQTFQPVADYQAALAFQGDECKVVFKQADDYFAQ
jgi:4'-phosphopantetheinyl transferase